MEGRGESAARFEDDLSPDCEYSPNKKKMNEIRPRKQTGLKSSGPLGFITLGARQLHPAQTRTAL